MYLPRGPLWRNEEAEATTLSTLSHHLPNHHIVCINYRFSQQHQYPTPVHDTLTGWQWILSNILPKRAISRPGRAEHVGRLTVCGELIGGGLASMLALTECRIGEPGVIAAAVNSPLVDWVSVGEQSPASVRSFQPGKRAVGQLLDLRRTLFCKPDRYFEPFASPLLLFRTSGVPLPSAPTEVELDDMEQWSQYEREEYAKQHTPNDVGAIDHAASEDVFASALVPVPSRRMSRRYPSVSLNLRLPSFRVSSGSLAPFTQQSKELIHVLRQSFVRQARQTTGGSSFGRKVLLEDEEDQSEDDDEKNLKATQKSEAEKKAQLHQHRDLGLWDGSKEGNQKVEEVAQWLKQKMQ